MTRTVAGAPPRAITPARRRARSAGIVLAIIGVSVFGGVLSPANAVPPSGPPVISSASAIYPDNVQPQIDFVAADNETDVYVTFQAVTDGATQSIYCSAGTFSGNSGSCTGTTALYPGIYDVYAVSDLSDFADPGGGYDPSAQSNVLSIEIYGVQDGEFLTGPTDPTSTDLTPAFSGTGPARGEIRVRANGSPTPICTTTVLADSTWSCDLPTSGVGTVYNNPNILAVDRASGTTGDTWPSFTIVAPPGPVFDPPTLIWMTDDPAEGVGGWQDPGVDRIVVEVDSGTGWNPYCIVSGNTDNTGWSCSEPATLLQLGNNDLRLTAYNANNDPATGSSIAQITLVERSALTSPADGDHLNTNTPTFSGTSGWEGLVVNVISYAGEGETTYCGGEVSGGQWSCELSYLDEGFHWFQLHTTYDGRDFYSDPFYVNIDTEAPGAPTIDGPGTSNGSYLEASSLDGAPTVTGYGDGFATITIYADGSPACTTVADSDGIWSCSLSALPAGSSYAISARQIDLAGNVSPVSGTQLVFTVLAPPVVLPAAQTLADVPPTKFGLIWSFSSGGVSEVLPGDQVVLSSKDLPPGANIDAELHSTPVKLGSTFVAPDGTFELPVTIPVDTTPGLHHFVVTLTAPGEDPSTVEIPVTVKAAPKAIAGPPEKTALEDAVPLTGATGTERDDPGAPSSLTHSINTLPSIFSNPIVLGIAGAAGLGLLLLIAFPAELLNSTISEQYPRFAHRVPRAPWLTRFTDWLERTPLFGGVAITLAAAVIFGFADPGFGIDITSVRVVLACGIALFIVGYIASIISGRIIRARWGLSTVLELKPLGLILTVIGVLLSRVLEFSPGFLLGLILGISIVGTTTAAERAKTTLVQAGVVFALAMLAWVGYSIATVVVDPSSFGGALLYDTLVAVTAEGLTALFIGLLPVKFLDGPAIFQFSKGLWAATYVVATVAFLALVLPSQWGEVGGSFGAWIAIVGGFAVVCLGIYLYFRVWAKPVDEPAPAEPQRHDVDA
jgi:hypothetical protein